MKILSTIKSFSIKSARLAWYIQDFMRNGSFVPSIREIKPTRKRVFVLGNGPSLSEDVAGYIQALQNEDIIMVNQALTHELSFQLKPRYYVLMDPAYFGILCKGQIDAYIKECVDSLNTQFSSVTWNMDLLVPHHFVRQRRDNSIMLDNSQIQLRVFNALSLYSFLSLERILYRYAFAIPSGINVLIAALCGAVSMGYGEIYLLGADSDFHKNLSVDSQNRLHYSVTHFYSKKKEVVYLPDLSLADDLSHVVQTFRAYEELAKLNFNIKNLSSYSMIDAFPRDSLENILNNGGGIA